MKRLQPLTYLAQKLLYLWIRTDIIQPEDLPVDDNTSVTVYVLQSRAWTDLLVLEQECKKRLLTRPLSRIPLAPMNRWHHVYTVAQAQPLTAWLMQEPKRSQMLGGLYRALKENPQLDVNFVPVMIFWGRPVLKQKHWLRVLFSDTWGFAGRTRRFFTILFNGKNTLVQFSPAISFREIIKQHDSPESTIDYLQNHLSTRLNEIRTATLGPDISHRRTLVAKLLENESVVQAIHERAENDGISRYQAAKIANDYLNEIVADRSYITIQILQRVLSSFWNRFYEGIDVYNSRELNALALTHELVYVPCHRSHIDYLLLSYVIHFEGLAIPYIAAGKNLNMPLIGPVLRKGGAFFIRRSFKGNRLYSTVLFEYLASQINSSMPIEYFVEGGRSRTGRLLQPKPGMLAMTVRAFLKYRQRPVAFVPVYIGYEKMIEGKAYLAELQGDDKKSETLIGSIRSFLKIRGFYGRVTTNFGEPVMLEDMLNRQYPDWKNENYNDEQRPEWLKQTVSRTARKIMQHINQAGTVNAVNLIATALLAAPNQAMDEAELQHSISFYAQLIRQLNYSGRIIITQQSPDEQIHHAQALGMVRRRKHELGDFIYLDKSHAVLLTYYRNNILHLLAIPSLLASCFINNSSLSRKKILRYMQIVYPFLRREFFLPWPAAELDAQINHALQLLSDSQLLIYNKIHRTYSKPRIGTELAQLGLLSQVISPLLELYYMIFALLAEHGSGTLTRERLEELCYLMAQRLSLMYEINSPDFFDKKLIANFINTLISAGYVRVNNEDRLELVEEALKEGRHTRRLLNRSMQYNILQMLRTATAHTE